MGDRIKDKIKEDPARQEVRDQIREGTNGTSLVPVKSRGSNLERLYGAATPVQVYHENPSLAQIEGALKKVDYGQRQLEVMRRTEDSPVYKAGITVYDGFMGLFGRRPQRMRDIYQLFVFQQQNVRELNHLLAEMTASYDGSVKYTRDTLDGLVVTVTKETRKRQELEAKSIPPEIERYENAVTGLSQLDKDADPEKYYSQLQEVIDSKRASRQMRFEYVVTATGQDHHRGEIDNLMLQEELFETMLYGVMETAFKTELYQRTLDSNIRVWSSIRPLSEAVRSVGKGIDILADFNRDVNQSYINAVRDITQIIETHPGRGLVETTNQDLRQLVMDVNSSSYRDASHLLTD
jgi:hypothetical protein